MLIDKPYHIVPRQFTIIFFLTYLYIIIISSLSDFSYDSLTYDGVIFYFRYYFFCLAILYLSLENKKLINNIIFISLITTIVVILDGTLQLATGKNILGWEILYRVSGLFKDELVIGVFLSKILVLCFTYYDLSYPKKYIKLRYLFIITGFIFLIYTRERSALVLFILYFLLYFLFVKKLNIKLILTIIFLITSILISTLLISEDISNYLFVTLSQINQSYIPYLPYPEGYEGLILSALNIFNENNILFGSGANSFRNLCELYSFKNFCTSHPHNYYIQTLIDLGLVGLIILILIYIRIIFLFFKIDDNDRLFKGFVLISLTYFFPLIPSMNFYNNWTNVIIFTPISISLYYWYTSKK